jgi:hypothetical protein
VCVGVVVLWYCDSGFLLCGLNPSQREKVGLFKNDYLNFLNTMPMKDQSQPHLHHPPAEHLKDVVLIFDLNHKAIESATGFPVRKEQLIHIEPVIGKACDANSPHEFGGTTLEFNDDLTVGTVRLYHRKNTEHYSFRGDPEWMKVNDPNYDWELKIQLEKNPGGPSTASFFLPENVDFKQHPRLDISTTVHKKGAEPRSIHGICRVYLNNA